MVNTANNCLSVFDHFVGLALKVLKHFFLKVKRSTCLSHETVRLATYPHTCAFNASCLDTSYQV